MRHYCITRCQSTEQRSQKKAKKANFPRLKRRLFSRYSGQYFDKSNSGAGWWAKVLKNLIDPVGGNDNLPVIRGEWIAGRSGEILV